MQVDLTNPLGVQDKIRFDIANQQTTIQPVMGGLPDIKKRVTMDGTPPAGKPNQVIILDGTNSGATNGLTIKDATANGSQVQGIQVTKFVIGIYINNSD